TVCRVTKVRLTGGEPLIRGDVVDLVRMLADEGVPDLALTTHGGRLAGLAAELRDAGLHRVNVSLDSLDPATYRKLTGGAELAPTLEGIDAALDAGLAPVKLNTVVLQGVNDDEVVAIAEYGIARGCAVRFLELMPIGPAAERFDAWFVPSAEVLATLEASFDLEPLGRTRDAASRDFRARDRRGRTGVVGLISPCTEPFCTDCRRLRLTATGKLLGCLAQADGIDVRPILAEGGAAGDARLVEAVDRALRLKTTGRRFGDQKPMVRIGG
ncbi:MAG TPA: radical SAM protein, partial [Planctomycetota bacterium]|nr:radical SAM protein [Planctomycetota bacterium]